MVWLRLLHIVAGVVWVGSAVFGAFVLMPTARAAGPEGARFVGRLMQRIGPLMGGAMLLTVIPGLMMYGRLSAGFSRAWVMTPTGLALGLGALGTIAAIVVGIAVNGPARTKMLAAPDAVDAAQLARMHGRIERGAQAVALLLVFAVAAMAVARYL